MLYLPPPNSSKGDNGVLLVIGGSSTYSGAALLALKSAIPFCDVVLFYPAEKDKFLISAVKTQLPEVIVVDSLKRALNSADAVVLGVGMGKAVVDVRSVLRKKVVVDGDGIRLVEGFPLSKRVLLTPNRREYTYLSSLHGISDVRKLANHLNALILKKGHINELSDGLRYERISGGNAGLTKAATGDVLAGIIGSLATKNSLWDAAYYGLKIVLKAADALFKQKSYFYTASDVAEMLPYAAALIIGKH